MFIAAELVNTTGQSIRGNIKIAFAIYDYLGNQITDLGSQYSLSSTMMEVNKRMIVKCHLPSIALNEGSYRYNVYCSMDGEVYDGVEYVGYFQVNLGDFYRTGKLPDRSQGSVLFEQKWNMLCVE